MTSTSNAGPNQYAASALSGIGRRPALMNFGLFTMFLGLLILGGTYIWFGNVYVLSDVLTRNDVAIHPQFANLGNRSEGEIVTASFTISNLTNHRIRLLRARSSCGCFEILGIPLDVPAFRSAIVKARISVASSASTTFTKTILVDTTCPQRKTLQLGVQCKVKEQSVPLEPIPLDTH